MAKDVRVYVLAASMICWQSATAYTCTLHTSYGEEFAKSFDVIEARVVDIQQNIPYLSPARVGEKRMHDIDVLGADAVTVRLYRSYKHRVNGAITLKNPHGPAAFSIKLGLPYVLFIRRDTSNGDLFIDKCGGSFPLLARDVASRLRTVSRLSQVQAPVANSSNLQP